VMESGDEVQQMDWLITLAVSQMAGMDGGAWFEEELVSGSWIEVKFGEEEWRRGNQEAEETLSWVVAVKDRIFVVAFQR
jgi:hypothetical protein